MFCGWAIAPYVCRVLGWGGFPSVGPHVFTPPHSWHTHTHPHSLTFQDSAGLVPIVVALQKLTDKAITTAAKANAEMVAVALLGPSLRSGAITANSEVVPGFPSVLLLAVTHDLLALTTALLKENADITIPVLSPPPTQPPPPAYMDTQPEVALPLPLSLSLSLSLWGNVPLTRSLSLSLSLSPFYPELKSVGHP